MSSNAILKLYEDLKLIESPEELRWAFAHRDADLPLVYDTETTSLIWGELSYNKEFASDEVSPFTDPLDEALFKPYMYPYCFGISLCIMAEGRAYLLWVRRLDENREMWETVIEILKRDCLKCCHNAKYDRRVMKSNGTIVAPEIDCTNVQSRIYFDRRQSHGLKALSEFLCPALSQWDDPIKSTLTKLKNKYTRAGYPKDFVNYSFIPHDVMDTYASLDAFMTLMLWIFFKGRADWG